MPTRDAPTPGAMRGGVRRPRGPNSSWSFVLYLGMQPAQNCVACGHRSWLGAERLEACPKCGGSLREARAPRQINQGGYSTRRDAEIARAGAVQRLGRGRYVPPERMTLAEYLRDRWLPAVEASSKLKQTTKEGYRRHVRYHLIGPAEKPHSIGLVELRKLNLETIRAHYAMLAEGYWVQDVLRGAHSRPIVDKATGKPKRGLVRRQGLSVQTLRRVHAALHGALAAAVELGMLDHNPAWHAAKNLGTGDEPEAELRAWSASELWAFLDSQDGEPLYPLWRTLAMTGMRRGEALGLKWGDVDLIGGCLTVRRNRVPVNGGVTIETSTKTKRVRVVELDAETVTALRMLQVHTPADLEAAQVDHDAYVFVDDAGEPFNPNSITYHFRLAVQAVGLRKIPLHGLRHTHATQLLDAHVPLHVVSRRLGHSTPNVTLGVYAHCLPGAQQDAVRAVARDSQKGAQ